MHPVFTKTFGGLSASYYFRNFFFGMLISLFVLGTLNAGSRPVGTPALLLVMLSVNTLLYPYSRFVYELVIGFIIGNNVFILNGWFMLFVKFMTMAMCWGAAILVAPIGLLYLYFHHSKTA